MNLPLRLEFAAEEEDWRRGEDMFGEVTNGEITRGENEFAIGKVV